MRPDDAGTRVINEATREKLRLTMKKADVAPLAGDTLPDNGAGD
jgi:hypothetical protein